MRWNELPVTALGSQEILDSCHLGWTLQHVVQDVQAMLQCMQAMLQGCRRCCRRCAGDAAEVQAMLPKMWLLRLCCQRLDVVVIPWNSRECHCENVYCLMPIVIHSGPFHHNVEFANIVGSAPREMRSAGLCCVETCCHVAEEVFSCMKATLLPTKVFHR